MSISELTEWDVSFVMAAGTKRRTFTMTVPATGRDGAEKAAYGLAYAINDGSGHIWKITDDVTIKEHA